MAKLINGELSGRFRDMVYRRTESFGVVVAEYNDGVYKCKAWSASQLYSRRKFKQLAGLSASFRKASNLGFELGKKVLSHPSFIKNNYNVLRDNAEGGFDVEYDRICVSRGVLPQLDELRCNVVEKELDLRWSYTPRHIGITSSRRKGKSSSVDRHCGDRIVVVMYCPSYVNGPQYKCKVYESSVRREACSLQVHIPDEFADNEVYLYTFVVDDESRSSDTQFVGELHDLCISSVALPVITHEDTDNDCLAVSVKAENRESVFLGLERRSTDVDGVVKHSFVMRFSVDEEEVDEVLEAPDGDDDYRPRIHNGRKHISKASETVLRMKRLIKVVNPAYYNERLCRGDDIHFESWDSLCDMVLSAVDGCEGVVVEWRN